MERVYCPRVLVSTLGGRFDYVTLRFCELLLGDCTITLSAVVAMLVHPERPRVNPKDGFDFNDTLWSFLDQSRRRWGQQLQT